MKYHGCQFQLTQWILIHVSSLFKCKMDCECGVKTTKHKVYIDMDESLKLHTYQGSSHGGRRRAVPPGTANFRPALGFKLDAPPGTNRTKICWICTNSIVFQASKVVVFAQCKFCMHYFAKDTHHTAREQNYFLENCSEPVHCDPFGRTAIRAPISELTPAQTLLGCARH